MLDMEGNATTASAVVFAHKRRTVTTTIDDTVHVPPIVWRDIEDSGGGAILGKATKGNSDNTADCEERDNASHLRSLLNEKDTTSSRLGMW